MAPEKSLVSCDTFVVLPDKSLNGSVIFGKNSDRPAGEVQEVIHEAAADHAAGSSLQCTYIAIPQATHTHAVVLSKPSWMWGAEMGANEHGVCIGNEAVWTSEPCEAGEERLLGMDLLRLGLERGSTALEAVKEITALLEKHGQGGACSDSDPSFCYHNSFLVADSTEAWVLETADKLWAAKKLTSGFYHLSNALSLAEDLDLCSEGLQDQAKARGRWDGEGKMHFAKCFSQDKSFCGSARLTGGEALLTSLTAEGGFGLRDMLQVLRDEPSGICRGAENDFPTQGSMASVLPPKGPASHWLTATPSPHLSVFKAFVFAGAQTKASLWTVSPAIENDPAKTVPRFSRPVDRAHTLYKLQKAAMEKEGKEKTVETLRGIEEQCIAETITALEDGQLTELADIFSDCVESEIKFYK